MYMQNEGMKTSHSSVKTNKTAAVLIVIIIYIMVRGNLFQSIAKGEYSQRVSIKNIRGITGGSILMHAYWVAVRPNQP